MIVLDTNVLSEMMRPEPTHGVETWLARQPAASLYTTVITQAEILYGFARLPHGRRRVALEREFRSMLEEDFADRVLAFDGAAAESYVVFMAARRRVGRPVSYQDAQIAAIALSRGAAVATRNISDFDVGGLDLINPWATHRRGH